MLMISRFSLFTLLTLFLLSPTITSAQDTPLVPGEIRSTWVCRVFGHCGDPTELAIVDSYPMSTKAEALEDARRRAKQVCSNFTETSNTCNQSVLQPRVAELQSARQPSQYWDVLVTGIMCDGSPIKYYAYGTTFCDAYRKGKTEVCIIAMSQCRKVRCYCWKVINKPCCCK
jgi:hypothetical protein